MTSPGLGEQIIEGIVAAFPDMDHHDVGILAASIEERLESFVPPVERIKILQLEPNDSVIVEVPAEIRVSHDARLAIQEAAALAFGVSPGRVFVAADGMQISALRSDA